MLCVLLLVVAVAVVEIAVAPRRRRRRVVGAVVQLKQPVKADGLVNALSLAGLQHAPKVGQGAGHAPPQRCGPQRLKSRRSCRSGDGKTLKRSALFFFLLLLLEATAEAIGSVGQHERVD